MSESRTGAEMAREMAALVIGMFGGVKATDEDRQALADALVAYSMRWVNDRFHLGVLAAPTDDPGPPEAGWTPAQLREAVQEVAEGLERMAFQAPFRVRSLYLNPAKQLRAALDKEEKHDRMDALGEWRRRDLVGSRMGR